MPSRGPSPADVELARASLRDLTGRDEQCGDGGLDARGDGGLDAREFRELLLRYEEARASQLFPRGDFEEFWHQPTSLQLDIVCRIAFLPCAAAILAAALLF